MINGTGLTAFSNCPVPHVITNGNLTDPCSGSGSGSTSASGSSSVTGSSSAASSGSNAVMIHEQTGGHSNNHNNNHNRNHNPNHNHNHGSHSHSRTSSSIVNNTTNPAIGTSAVSCCGSSSTGNESINTNTAIVNVRNGSNCGGNRVFNDLQHTPANVCSSSLTPVLLQYSNSAISMITSIGNALGGNSDNIGNEELNAKDTNLDVVSDHLLTTGNCSKHGCNSNSNSGNDSCSSASAATGVNMCSGNNIVSNIPTNNNTGVVVSGVGVGVGGSIVAGLTNSMIGGGIQHSSPQAPPTYVNL